MATAGEYVISHGSNDTMVCKTEGQAEKDFFFLFYFFFSLLLCEKLPQVTGGNGDQIA